MSRNKAIAVLVSTFIILAAAAVFLTVKLADHFHLPERIHYKSTESSLSAAEDDEDDGVLYFPKAPTVSEQKTAMHIPVTPVTKTEGTSKKQIHSAETNGAAEKAEPAEPEESKAPENPAGEASASEASTSESQATTAVPEETVPDPVITPFDAVTIPPQSEKKDDAYFAGSCFIGGSRIQGLMLYGTLYDAFFICDRGYSVDRYFNTDLGIEGGGTGSDLLKKKKGSFREVYLAFGINELGWPLDSFIDFYGDVIFDVKKYQPEANIYVLAILPTSKEYDSDPYFSNANIKKFNEQIAELTRQYGVYYLDASEVIGTDNGALPEADSTDGIHFGRDYVLRWQEFIQQHVVPAKF